jgi:hypothetical protein
MSRDRRGERGERRSSFRCGHCRLDVSTEALGHRSPAGDDNPLTLLRLAVKPLAQPPFPMERIGQL